jgi:hypothetical protein
MRLKTLLYSAATAFIFLKVMFLLLIDESFTSQDIRDRDSYRRDRNMVG